MPDQDPTKRSADAEAMSDYLQTVDDVLEGVTGMKRNFKRYVQQFPHEQNKRYDLRKSVAKMTNVFRDVLEGLASKPFGREVEVSSGSGPAEDLLEDIDGRGNNLTTFAGQLFFQGVADSISWIRVDYPAGQQFRNREEERQAGVRPYWSQVNHSAILEIQSERQGAGERITYMRMWEDAETILVLRPGDWERWRKNDAGIWDVDEFGQITIGVVPMVPFITGRRKGKKWVFHPPMKDALDLQVALFRKECALEFAEMMTAFPMLSANGVEPDTDAEGNPKPLDTGPDTVLYAPPNAEGQHGSWNFVEPATESLKFLAEQIDAVSKEIRELGRQPLTAQSGNLTRISAAQAASKGNSAVQQWAAGLKDALENALYITNLWMDAPDTEPEVDVYTDFRADTGEEQTPTHLLTMRQNGDISREGLWMEFQRLGELSDNFDPDEESERLISELPGGIEE